MSGTPDTEWLVNQIAHALRNPIFAAMVQTDAIAMRAASDPTLTRPAATLAGQLDRLEAILEEMLLFGRPARLAPRRVQVASLLDELATSYAEGTRTEPAEVTVRKVDPALEVDWDPDAVRAVLERLLDNAVEHTEPPHRVELRLSLTDSTVVLEVHDEGHGMAPAILERATMPFFPQHRGRPGLGLAVAHKLATAHGGMLEISSTPAVGTTVTVTLPRSTGA